MKVGDLRTRLLDFPAELEVEIRAPGTIRMEDAIGKLYDERTTVEKGIENIIIDGETIFLVTEEWEA